MERVGQGDIDSILAEAMSEAQGAVDDVQDVLGAGEAEDPADRMELLGDVELDVSIELGRTDMVVEDVLRLGQGAVVELDKLAGDPVDVLVNGRLVARGEVLVLNDNFCIRVSEIVADLEEEAQAAMGESPDASEAEPAEASAG